MENKNNKKKEITIDDLAMMVQNGFTEVNGKIDHMNQRLSEIEITTKEIKAELNKKVDKIDHNTLVYRVEKLEKNFA